MSGPANLRVVVACVTFETVMVVRPVEFYRADRVYLIHYARKPPYTEFLREVEYQLRPLVRECERVEVNVNSFSNVLRALLGIIRKEKSAGNHVYVNISAGPNVYGAAALVACGMEGAVPFSVGVREYTVRDMSAYFVDGRPVGLARAVYDPSPLPEFEIRAPKRELVEGLRVLSGMLRRRAIMSAANIVRCLEREGLMGGVLDGRERVTQSAIMRYRRNFLEPWLRNGWVRGRGRELSITELGGTVLEIFG